MSPFETFQAKLDEYATNNIHALEGRIQVTHNEREDLKMHFQQLDAADQTKALALLKAKGIDTEGWARGKQNRK